MKEMLKEKSCDYLINNNPALVIRLQEGNSVAKCIEGKINAYNAISRIFNEGVAEHLRCRVRL